MTRAELTEIADSFHALSAAAEAIEAHDKDSYGMAVLAWQQVAERLCVIDHCLAKAFPMMADYSDSLH